MGYIFLAPCIRQHGCGLNCLWQEPGEPAFGTSSFAVEKGVFFLAIEEEGSHRWFEPVEYTIRSPWLQD